MFTFRIRHSSTFGFCFRQCQIITATGFQLTSNRTPTSLMSGLWELAGADQPLLRRGKSYRELVLPTLLSRSDTQEHLAFPSGLNYICSLTANIRKWLERCSSYSFLSCRRAELGSTSNCPDSRGLSWSLLSIYPINLGENKNKKRKTK